MTTMASLMKRSLLLPLRLVLGDRRSMVFTRRWWKGIEEELGGRATDRFLGLLLNAMDLAFCLNPAYRANINGFKARYLLRSCFGTCRTIDTLVGV
jgi:hypothetical protein